MGSSGRGGGGREGSRRGGTGRVGGSSTGGVSVRLGALRAVRLAAVRRQGGARPHLYVGVLAEELPVLVEAAVGVTHRMGVLAEDQRLLGVLGVDEGLAVHARYGVCGVCTYGVWWMCVWCMVNVRVVSGGWRGRHVLTWQCGGKAYIGERTSLAPEWQLPRPS